MTFWALENADDITITLFGGAIIIFFLVVSVVVVRDWILKKNKGNGKG